MRAITKNRLALTCVGLPTLIVGTFLSAGLTFWLTHVLTHGMEAPRKFGWIDTFILAGFAGLVVSVPALVLFLIASIVLCPSLAQFIRWATLVSVGLGFVVLLLTWLLGDMESIVNLLLLGTTSIGVSIFFISRMKITARATIART